jgi:hypothetical protein
MIAAKASVRLIRVFTLFKNELLRTNIKLTLQKALNMSVMAYDFRLGIRGTYTSFEIAAFAK